MGAGTSSENANGAFEFSMTASVFGYWHDAYPERVAISGGSLSRRQGITLPKCQERHGFGFE
jgi:hypothetical protein